MVALAVGLDQTGPVAGVLAIEAAQTRARGAVTSAWSLAASAVASGKLPVR